MNGAKLVGGVWLPETEVHFVDMLLHNKKAHLEVDGVCTYQMRKLQRAIGFVDFNRRRTCLDIGAHVGLWSMWLAKMFAKIEAFEPIPLHRDLFALNVKGNYTLHATALGETEGVVDFRVPEQTTGNAHIAIEGLHPGTKHVENPDRFRHVPSVPMRTLDSFGFTEVDFIKIDVEGYELPVVKGAGETLLREKPVVVIEQKGNESAYGHKRDAAILWLQTELGMKPLDVVSGDWIMGW